MNAYETRRARWLKLAGHLPHELKERIALRNIRAVTGLSPNAQHTLTCALDTGLRQASAIRILQNHPYATLDDLIRQMQGKQQRNQDCPPLPPEEAPGAQITHELAALILTCFPGWNRLAAESLANDPLAAELRALLHAWKVCQDSERARSETFTVLLCGFIAQAAEHLNHILKTQPNHRAVLQNSPVAWSFISSIQAHGEHA